MVRAANIVNRLLESDEDELDALACEFIEDVVGRFDWKNNWKKYKERNNAKAKIAEWFSYLGDEIDPQFIFDRINEIASKWNGSWK